VLRLLSDEEIAWKSAGTAQYQELALRSLATMRVVAPLNVADFDRPRMAWDTVLPLHLHKNTAPADQEN